MKKKKEPKLVLINTNKEDREDQQTKDFLLEVAGNLDAIKLKSVICIAVPSKGTSMIFSCNTNAEEAIGHLFKASCAISSMKSYEDSMNDPVMNGDDDDD